MARLTNICFTINNPGDAPIPFDVAKMHYLVYQREIGESGTIHYQGYVELKSATRLAGIKTLLGHLGAHLAQRRGTAKQASDYCKKDDTRAPGHEFIEHGEMKETNPGQRTDIIAFKDAVRAGKRKRELIDDFPMILCRYPRFYDTCRQAERPRRTNENKLEVILLIGPPGCGKTRAVYNKFDAVYQELWTMPISAGSMWFDTYDLQKYVLLDDFAGKVNHFPLTSLLQILDRYPCLVPVKGAFVWWMPNRIYVTTNIYPRDWYGWDDRKIQYRSLSRRFTRVYDFYRHQADPPVGAPRHQPPQSPGEAWMREERPETVETWELE